MKIIISLILFFALSTVVVHSEDRLELETTFIKGNKELPQILYVVPWKDIKRSRNKEQQIILYSLFGDLFDPVNLDEINNHTRTDNTIQLKP
ncbi:MAG: hypothetical protein OQK75_07090 [Gammaproteobacteria bacterium]|nr:hypothetical protein [Gammaproteobacteria bacterium]